MSAGAPSPTVRDLRRRVWRNSCTTREESEEARQSVTLYVNAMQRAATRSRSTEHAVIGYAQTATQSRQGRRGREGGTHGFIATLQMAWNTSAVCPVLTLTAMGTCRDSRRQ